MPRGSRGSRGGRGRHAGRGRPTHRRFPRHRPRHSWQHRGPRRWWGLRRGWVNPATTDLYGFEQAQSLQRYLRLAGVPYVHAVAPAGDTLVVQFVGPFDMMDVPSIWQGFTVRAVMV